MVGKLRNKIDILNFSTISNGSGGLIEAWRIDKSVFASITPTSGFRGLEASQIGLNQTYKVIIRYEDYPILSRVNKIQFENRILIIHEYKIINERRQYIEIRCEEDAGQDVIIYDENFQPITDQNGNYLTT
jgi:SPP1 family predicted phage head-tail adaptor